MFVLLSIDKKAKTISLKAFKIMDFKNVQQETTKKILSELMNFYSPEISRKAMVFC